MSTAQRTSKNKAPKKESASPQRTRQANTRGAAAPARESQKKGRKPPAARPPTRKRAAPRKSEPHVPIPVDPSELTAQPVGLAEELNVHLRDSEEGLSIEPEEMGRQYLSDAIEQGDYEAVPDSDADELSIDSGASSDRALSGPNIEAEDDIWENTVNQTLEAGSAERALEELAPAASAVERADDELDEELESPEDVDELDLTDTNVHEASLFDHEGKELGEVESPELNTDDTHTHARKGRPAYRP
jgi:hypothetical protein